MEATGRDPRLAPSIAASESSKATDDSVGTFFRIVTVAWSYLRPRDARAIRVSCKDGRLLHDSLTTSIALHLGGRERALEPHPQDLARSLGAARARGMLVRDISLRMAELREGDDPACREQQILMVLSSLPASSAVEIVDFNGHPHLTTAVVEAVAAIAPARLFLAYDQPPPVALASAAGPALPLRDANTYAAFELLMRCLPGLIELSLQGATHWPVLMLHSLHLATRLTDLTLELNEVDSDQALTNADLQSSLHAVSGLPQLQRLHLESTGGRSVARHFPHRPDACRLDLACLASLTRLTRLSLDLEVLHHEDNTWVLANQPPEQRQRWAAVWEAQRAGLSAALRAMPELTSLRLMGMQLHVGDLAGLAELQHLTLRGLLLPAPPPSAVLAAPADPRVRLPLPPRLRELRILQASPTVLGSLVPPASLNGIGMLGPSRIAFTPLDLHPSAAVAGEVGAEVGGGAGAAPPGHRRGSRLSAAAVGAFRSTVQLLRGRLLRTRLSSESELLITGEGAREALRPPLPPPLAEIVPTPAHAAVAADAGGSAAQGEGARNAGASVDAADASGGGGHAPWLSALAALQLRALRLEHVHLDSADLACIASSLCSLEELDLGCSAFPPESLPALATLKHLTTLAFTWAAGASEYGTWGVAEAVEGALLRLATEAPSLAAVCVHPPAQPLHAGTCRPVVEGAQAQLADRGSRMRVSLECLALFEACFASSSPLESVVLSGHLHLTSAITAAIAARA